MAFLPFQRKEIPKDALHRLGITVVYLFGSHAEGVAGSLSDIDIGMLCDKTASQNRNELYQALYDIFTDVFDMSNYRDIDIVFLEHASLELRFDVITHGKILFESDVELRLKFEERTAALYRDFKPLRDAGDQAILQRI